MFRLLPLLILGFQDVVVTVWNEGRPLAVERSITGICSDKFIFTVYLKIGKAASITDIKVNGFSIPKSELNILGVRAGIDQIVDVYPIECFGDGGDTGAVFSADLRSQLNDAYKGKFRFKIERGRHGWKTFVD